MTTTDTRTVGSIVGGRTAADAPGGRVQSTNPARLDESVAEVLLGDADTFVEACRAARAAQAEWAAVPAPVRGRAIQQVGRLVEANKEALARLVTQEIGKPYAESLGEVQEIVDTCDFFLGEGRRLYGQTVPSEMPDKQLFTFRVPVGVAAIITAGNFPVAVPSWYLVPALLCGNTVVWKPAEYAPALGDALAQLFLHGGSPTACSTSCWPTASRLRRPLARAGRGPGRQGRLHRLLRRRARGRRAVRPPPAVAVPGAGRQEPARGHGRRRARPRRRGRAVLGLRDRRPALHVAGHGDGADTVHDAFMERFGAAVRQAPIGDPTADVLYGPMIHERFDERFLDWLELVRDHHTVTARPDGPHPRQPARGLRRRPRRRDLLPSDDRRRRARRGRALLDRDLRAFRGRGTFYDFPEAIELANGHGYGLSAAIYTTSRQHAFRFRERGWRGDVSVNNSTSGAEAHLPFGGNGKSGNGSRQSGSGCSTSSPAGSR